MGVARGHGCLHFHGAFDGLDNTGKFQQKTVARLAHQPPAMVRHDWHHGVGMGVQGGKRAFFVIAH
jgi:hypothetical protein